MDEIREMSGESKDILTDNIQKLKELFPEVVTEGKIDFEQLKEVLGNYAEDKEERYKFEWHGKSQALRLSQTPSTGTLRPCKEESKNWEDTENLYIEGDNLEVLKLLQKTYHNRIKMIYIDPPYNTGNDFVYPDNYKDNLKNYLGITGQLDEEGNRISTNSDAGGEFHTKWLNMMYPRLRLARNLLSDDGVIFISIDDNEVHNLRKVCDEVFGEGNFISLLSVENNPKGRKNSKFISTTNDFCLLYAKNKNKSSFKENIPKKCKDMMKDENGIYIHKSGKRVIIGKNGFNKKVNSYNSEKHYSVYYNKERDQIILKKEKELSDIDQNLIEQGFSRYISFRNDSFIENTYTREKFKSLFKQKALEFQETKIFEKNFNSSIRMKSILTNKEYEAIVYNQKRPFKIDLKTTSAGTLFKELFNTQANLFSSPKNVGLIKLLASLFHEKHYIILDFFSGSATTAHAVMKLNAEDGGDRKYIMVQLPEPTDEKSEAYKAGYKNISDIGKERIRRAGDKIVSELKEQQNGQQNLTDDEEALNPDELDIGFKVFKLDSSNLKKWNPDHDDLQNTLENMITNIVDGRSEEDLLYEIMLKFGIDLTYPIETEAVDDKNVYNIGNGALFICLDKNITTDVADFIASKKDEINPEITRVVFRDNGFTSDADKTNVVHILKNTGIEEIMSV